MNARETILAAVRSSRPPAVAPPDLAQVQHAFPRSDEDLGERMVRVASAGGSHVVQGTRDGLRRIVSDAYPNAKRVLSMVEDAPGNSTFGADPHRLDDVDVFICEGTLGVAEDGSVWLPATRLRHRAALFIAAHVVLVLDRTRIVENLHDAYAKIDITACEFGVFVAGPSKTADIEQALVVGAHGPKSLTLVLLDS